MWPVEIDWQQLRFGVEIEFVGGAPEAVELLPGWVMALDELQTDDLGHPSGSELKPGPITWGERGQIQTMLERLKAAGGNLRGDSDFSPAGDCRPQGAQANWSCGLHVHVDLSPWGEAILLPLMDAALAWQDAFYELLQTAPHRRLYCPPVTPAMREALAEAPSRDAVRRWGDPESNRCGFNLGSWWDIGTVEIRFTNGSLDFEEICRTIELCLRFVTAVGADQLTGVGMAQRAAAANRLTSALGDSGPSPGYTQAALLATLLGAPVDGYPPARPCPPWRWEQIHLTAQLRPVLEPLVTATYPGGQILATKPTTTGFQVTVELDDEDETNVQLTVLPPLTGWRLPE